MNSSSTKDMDSLVISGGTLAAEGSSGLAGDPVLDVLLSEVTRILHQKAMGRATDLPKE